MNWGRAVAAVQAQFAAFNGELLACLQGAIRLLKLEKMAIFDLTASEAGEKICAGCQGKCCESGKYHFTVIDLLVYLNDGKELFTPRFGNKRCPYLGEAGCLMDPEYRPFNCITFNCESLEALLAYEDVKKFYALENALRGHYLRIRQMCGKRTAHGLLSYLENDAA